jgi:hypothetical protein
VKVAVATNAQTSMETSIEIYGHLKKNPQTNRESFGEMCFPVANSTNYAYFWEKKERCLLGFTILSLGPKGFSICVWLWPSMFLKIY